MLLLLTLSHKVSLLTGTWAFLVLAALAIFGLVQPEYYFVLFLVGFLIIVEIYSPLVSRPRWRLRMLAAAMAGILGFAAIVVVKSAVLFSTLVR